MTEALFIVGIFQSVLDEIIEAQQNHPGEAHYLQPYSSTRILALSQSPPTSQNPMRLYISTTERQDTVAYTGQIVAWADTTSMPDEQRGRVYEEIQQRQPAASTLYGSGHGAIGRPSVNLLTVAGLERLDSPFPASELTRVSDGRPYASGRATASGWVSVNLHGSDQEATR